MEKLHLNEEVSALYRQQPKNRIKVTRGHTPRKNENYVHEKAGRRSGENYVNEKAGRRSGENYIHEKACRRCGTSHLAKQCPAWGKECYACKKKNHFSKFCRTNQVHLIGEDSDSDTLHIKVDNIEHKLLATVNVLAEGQVSKQITCQLDTAATCNMLSVKDYHKLGDPPLKPIHARLTMYEGIVVRSKGRCQLEVCDDKRNVPLMFEVVETKHCSLLSLDTCLHLNVLSVNEHVHLVNTRQYRNVDAMLEEYPVVFSGLGCPPGEYDIVVDNSVKPVQNRPRKVAYAIKDDLQKKITALEEQKVIAKVDIPTPWISNCLAIRKSNGTVRVCIDPTDLNKAIQRNHFPLPTIEEVLPKLKDAKIFSLVYAKDGFLQVKLTNESSYLTTFWTPFGKYRWLRMAFGLTSSPEEYQRRLQLALDGLDEFFIVADDILIIGRGETDEETRRDHDKNLDRLLQRAREQNLKLNKAKMRLHLTEIKYIGHVLSPEGVKADLEKVSDTSSLATPTDSDQVRRFLGFANYLAKFLPNLSILSEPLRRIIQKDVELQWGQTQEDAFRKIKEVATSEQSLAYYDVKKPIVLECDSSTQGLGASLVQDGKPVAYVSRSLTNCEQKYAPIELECLAIVFTCRKFDQYIYGHAEVTIHSDHKRLEAIFRKSLLEAPKRLQRMMLAVQRYNVKVEYKPGTEQHGTAVASRQPVNEMSTELIFQCAIQDELAEEIDLVDSQIMALWRTTNCAIRWRTSVHQCGIRSVCKQLGIQTLHVIAVSFAIEWKSRIGSQDREEFSEEIGRPFESGVGVEKYANVSNQLQSSATANAKTHAGVCASSGAVDETRGTNGTSNPQTQGEEA